MPRSRPYDRRGSRQLNAPGHQRVGPEGKEPFGPDTVAEVGGGQHPGARTQPKGVEPGAGSRGLERRLALGNQEQYREASGRQSRHQPDARDDTSALASGQSGDKIDDHARPMGGGDSELVA